jgi:hypothetical protein
VTWGVILGKAQRKYFLKVKIMFEHSIRVPRLYKVASKIAKEVSEGKGSIKQLVYEGKHTVSFEVTATNPRFSNIYPISEY